MAAYVLWRQAVSRTPDPHLFFLGLPCYRTVAVVSRVMNVAS